VCLVEMQPTDRGASARITSKPRIELVPGLLSPGCLPKGFELLAIRSRDCGLCGFNDIGLEIQQDAHSNDDHSRNRDDLTLSAGKELCPKSAHQYSPKM